MVSEDAVRKHVAAAVRKADLNTVTAKQIRRNVEKQLNLEQDELSSTKWKSVVKAVIEETMEALQNQETSKEKLGDEEESGGEEIRPRKKRRTNPIVLISPTSSPIQERAEPISPAKRKDTGDDSGYVSQSPAKKKKEVPPAEESDSDMSVLIDSTPPVKKSAKIKSKDVSRLPKSKPKEADNTKSTGSSDQERIKELKSLVFKCGVRKNWSKELPSSMSASQQISHLTNLLHSLGMKGKLSAGKAKKIKEERELKDELDFIVQTAKTLGTGHRRRL